MLLKIKKWISTWTCFIDFIYVWTLGGAAKSEILPNQQLSEELHKSITRKFEKLKVHPLIFYRTYLGS